jgi:hypothetical protein
MITAGQRRSTKPAEARIGARHPVPSATRPLNRLATNPNSQRALDKRWPAQASPLGRLGVCRLTCAPFRTLLLVVPTAAVGAQNTERRSGRSELILSRQVYRKNRSCGQRKTGAFHSLSQGGGVMKLPPEKGCRSIVTVVTCVIPLTEQQFTTTSIVTAIVITGTIIVIARPAGVSHWRAVVAPQVDRHVRSWERISDHVRKITESDRPFSSNPGSHFHRKRTAWRGCWRRTRGLRSICAYRCTVDNVAHRPASFRNGRLRPF